MHRRRRWWRHRQTADSVRVQHWRRHSESDRPERDELVDTRAISLSSSFPSNQYTPGLTDEADDSLWLNVGRGVRGLAVGSLSETAAVETESGANWLEQTPDGSHVIVSAREPSHTQFRLDADPTAETFGEVTAEIDRTPEGGRGDRDGPGPCDITIIRMGTTRTSRISSETR
ncbi:hypothetical protein [Haloferax sp. ATB1]|uniref:hypothetical protein n=1 Tax=Haloferax sp. ATB1 TaxID=1508454 RepID=UPI000AD09595|nr:hypothetical protein [Haloferax sp. ATB1]